MAGGSGDAWLSLGTFRDVVEEAERELHGLCLAKELGDGRS